MPPLRPRASSSGIWCRSPRGRMYEAPRAEREGLELYPAEARLVDTANQYHLWVMPPGVRLEIGWDRRSVLDHDEIPIPGAVQRPL